MVKDSQSKVLISINNFNEKSAMRNKISTTKYTWWNFLPLFLWEQFKQFQNIYYLLNAIAGYFVPLIEPIANVIPLVFVLVMACVRELIEDISKKISDREQNSRLFTVIRNKKQMFVRSNMICQGDLLLLKYKDECPCDCLILQSEESGGTAFISTSCLDGETTLKPRYVVFHDDDVEKLKQKEFIISTEQANSNLTDFHGQIDDNFFNINNAILRGARLESQFPLLLAVVFVGRQTKIMYKQDKPRAKSSKLQYYMYNIILYQVILSLLFSLIFPLVSILTQKKFRDHYVTFAAEPVSTGVNFLEKFITYFILLAYFIPVSFFVSLEVSRLVGSMQFDNDRKLQVPEFVTEMKKKGKRKDKNAESLLDMQNVYQLSSQCRNIISIENLADLDAIFVDKTGTLTKNDMKFKNYYSVGASQSKFDGQIYDSTMLFSVALCNSVLVVNNNYQAEFPDELAFCKVAEESGLKLMIRQKQNIIYEYIYKIDQYEIKIPMQFTQHAIIEFTSDRKRMSIILQENGFIYSESKEQQLLLQNGLCQLENDHLYFVPEAITRPGKPFILTKGADNVMEQIMTETIINLYRDDIQHNLHMFSTQGLRTLVFAARQLDDTDMQLVHRWQEILQTQESYDKAASQLENNLHFIGVSAIEDQLQENVPETLNSFINAGIRIWMLTGDKTETAINVGYSAGLITNRDEIFQLTHTNYKNQYELNDLLDIYLETQEKMISSNYKSIYKARRNSILKMKPNSKSCYQYSCKYMNKTVKNDEKTRTIVIMDSITFDNILKYNYTPKLYVLMQFAKAGICCRLLSYQKANIIKNCHNYLQYNTLAIGDGGNDILMIQEAKTGMGIAGKEGLHACNNADITLPNFSFLKRMVFVYGHLFHIRNAELFEYIIEKNCVIAYAHVIYSFFNLFSVQVIMDSFLLLLFNVFITVFPIFFQSFTEIDVDISVLEKYPNIYKLEPLKYRPNVKYFCLRTFNSIYASFIMIMISRYMNQNTVMFSDGKLNDINSEAYLQFISMLFIISIQFVLHQNYYTYFTLSSLILTILGTIFTTWVGSYTNFFGIMLLGVPQQCSLSIGFHLRYLIITILACIPSVFFEVIKRLYFPSISDLYRFRYNDSKGKCVNPYKQHSSSYKDKQELLLKQKYYTVDVYQEQVNV